MAWYREAVAQVERTLASALAASQAQANATPAAIGATLQSQHATFVALASKTAAVDAELQKVKALYTQLWRAKTGSMRDPFEERGVADVGLDGL
jgi:nucleoporin p58/p45